MGEGGRFHGAAVDRGDHLAQMLFWLKCSRDNGEKVFRCWPLVASSGGGSTGGDGSSFAQALLYVLHLHLPIKHRHQEPSFL